MNTLSPAEQESLSAVSPEPQLVRVNGEVMTISEAVERVSSPASPHYPSHITERRKAENLDTISSAVRLGLRGRIGIDGYVVQLVHADSMEGQRQEKAI